MPDSEILPVYVQQSLYPWLTPVWSQLFHQSVQNNHFPHAILLTGIADIGKKSLAFYLAKGLLCESSTINNDSGLLEPCHQCRSCQLFSAGSHPDLLHITTPEEKKVIPVDAIRELIEWSVLSSQLGTKKVIVIEPADAMNQNAANSLLKTLEEPVPDTFIILVSSKKQALLPTIKSRCQSIDIPLPEEPISLSWLEQQGVENAKLMLSIASGAPIKAMELAQKNMLEARNTLMTQLLSIHNDGADPVFIADALVKLSKTTKNKTELFSHYDVIYWFDALVMDIARLSQNGQKNSVCNVDYYENLHSLTNRLYLKKILQLSDSINKAYFEIQGSINVSLLFEKLLIDWKNCRI